MIFFHADIKTHLLKQDSILQCGELVLTLCIVTATSVRVMRQCLETKAIVQLVGFCSHISVFAPVGHRFFFNYERAYLLFEKIARGELVVRMGLTQKETTSMDYG